jgi:hypothetical protein
MELPESLQWDDIITTILDSRWRIVFQDQDLSTTTNTLHLAFSPQQPWMYMIAVRHEKGVIRAKVIYR